MVGWCLIDCCFVVFVLYCFEVCLGFVLLVCCGLDGSVVLLYVWFRLVLVLLDRLALDCVVGDWLLCYFRLDVCFCLVFVFMLVVLWLVLLLFTCLGLYVPNSVVWLYSILCYDLLQLFVCLVLLWFTFAVGFLFIGWLLFLVGCIVIWLD